MKMTNREMLNMQATLTEIGKKEIDCVLGVTIARNNYELMKMTEPVKKASQELLRKYAEKDEKGKLIQDEKKNIKLVDSQKYHEEEQRLMEAEGEVKLTKFSMADIKKMSPTPNQIMYLFPVIEEKK